jgi:hypothetical protein
MAKGASAEKAVKEIRRKVEGPDLAPGIAKI